MIDLWAGDCLLVKLKDMRSREATNRKRTSHQFLGQASRAWHARNTHYLIVVSFLL